MNDNKNHYRENSFTLVQSSRYTLLLQFELKWFGYAIIYNNRLMAFGENCAYYELNDNGQLRDTLAADYKNVVIGLPSTGLTLVPNNLYNEGHVADFARFLDVQDGEIVLAQTLDDENRIIYKTDEVIVSAARNFGIQNTVYTAKGWIKANADRKPLVGNLYIEIGDGAAQFLYFSEGPLRFYNIFEAIDEDDLVYFSILVARQLNLEPDKTTVILSGNISKEDNKFARLAEFFGKVELNHISIIELPWHIAPHKILAHAALLLCVSSEAF